MSPYDERQHRKQVERRFRMAPGEYDAMLALQQGRCAICGHQPRTQRLAVDHDRVSGIVRGLLCSGCNRGIGLWEHDAGKSERAAAYLWRVANIVKGATK